MQWARSCAVQGCFDLGSDGLGNRRRERVANLAVLRCLAPRELPAGLEALNARDHLARETRNEVIGGVGGGGGPRQCCGLPPRAAASLPGPGSVRDQGRRACATRPRWSARCWPPP